MKKLLTKIISSVLVLSLALPLTAFGRADYANEYHYDNMADVYKFDLGTFRDTGAVAVENSSYTYYTNLLNKLGFISYTDAGRYLLYGDFVKSLNKLAYNQDINTESELSADAQANVTMKDAVMQMCNILGFLNLYDESEALITATRYGLLKGIT